MRARTLLMTLTVLGLIGIVAAPGAEAAKSAAMTACSGQWDTMKKDNKLPKDETWSQFWSQCSKDFAAKNPAAATAKPAKAEKTAKPETAAKPEAAAAPKEVKKTTAAVEESDTPGSTQQKRDCDAKWDQHKTASGAHGWHDYFKFMAGCI
jgi:pyruvate/2-oxoglutarate dehydrogenase complex dihydrolipoamide acyltransferase (E2) component